MKYCYQCGKMTQGEPLFCSTCGRSYDVKLCPRLHANPRGAQVCSKCGSRELSTPQPRIPAALRLLGVLVRLGLGLLLFYLTLAFLVELVRSPRFQETLVAFGLLLGALWVLWMKLPDWFRELVRSFWFDRRHRNDD